MGSLSKRNALALFAAVIVIWGTQWTVTRAVVQEIPPLWASSIRTVISAIAAFSLLAGMRRLVVPQRSDWPVVLSIGILHMVGFAAFMAIGLKLIPVGRSIVLGYTTPLWVIPGAWLLLGERIALRGAIGAAFGLAGLSVLLNPLSLDWSNQTVLLGNLLILLAALSWSASILYIRAHRWTASPIQLLPWETLVASLALCPLALLFEGLPPMSISKPMWALLVYSALIGTIAGYWAMTEVNRNLPASTTSVGILVTPIVGIVSSWLLLGEGIELAVVVAAVLIGLGIALAFAKTAVRLPNRS
jgi:drug/metabolite transporter (DMT)-like permease